MMKVVILKYNAGNVRSVDYALRRMGLTPLVSDSEREIKTADRVIIPGVGEASSALGYLREKNLDRLIKKLTVPVLGICLGMQILCSFTAEGDVMGLGVFEGQVKKFSGSEKIPHMGWNRGFNLRGDLFEGINNSYFYFVHSYFVENSVNTVGTCEYMGEFSAALQSGNFYGVQFHPEKSGSAGQKVLWNFCKKGGIKEK